MTDDPKWTGSGYSPTKAWKEIRRKDRERELEAGSRGGGWLALAFVICCVVFVICVISFLSRLF